MYEFHWLPGSLVQPKLILEFAELYSFHYGVWGEGGRNPGRPIRLSAERISRWLVPDSLVVWATALGQLVGYAIAVQTKLPYYGMVSWVTQLVVHEDHRKQDVGKTLLFTIWRFTDHFAWGILTANPYAIRALEKATRRRCHPGRIKRHIEPLRKLGSNVVPYLSSSTDIAISSVESRIDTDFYVDHSQLLTMLSAVVNREKPWTLGPLPEGWEWFAFTFQDQDQIPLTKREIQEMLTASDNLTKHAYSRMSFVGGGQAWASHHESEAQFIIQHCELGLRSSVVDFGCGQGRHAIALATKGIRVTGIDYVPEFIQIARQQAIANSLANVEFETADCREAELGNNFDVAICLYDVVGSYADDRENLAILVNLVKHVKPGGYILISVMNMELTERIAKHWFSVASEPDKLLTLQPGRVMETTGDIFDPERFLIDRETKIVYRKEQFVSGHSLPEELLIRDRRYTDEQIASLCVSVGLEVKWSRFVRAGKWDDPLPRDSDRAKEILVFCQKPSLQERQRNLFDISESE